MTVSCPGCEVYITRDAEGFAKCRRCGTDLFITAEGKAVPCCDVSNLPGVQIVEVSHSQQLSEAFAECKQLVSASSVEELQSLEARAHQVLLSIQQWKGCGYVN